MNRTETNQKAVELLERLRAAGYTPEECRRVMTAGVRLLGPLKATKAVVSSEVVDA